MFTPEKWPGWKRKAKYRMCTFCGHKVSARRVIHDPIYDTPICRDRVKCCLSIVGVGKDDE